ncbi:hypothetical protein ACFWNT_29755 [Streptomyces sp. NPDC058409]|uniref:hypothetical protein n=1 Tax=Streptomyces sp. NPDC058409 TaxID=3346484 RepID=UPI003649FAE8
MEWRNAPAFIELVGGVGLLPAPGAVFLRPSLHEGGAAGEQLLVEWDGLRDEQAGPGAGRCVGLALHPGGELVALAGVLGLVLRLLDGGCGCGCVVVGHDAALC